MIKKKVLIVVCGAISATASPYYIQSIMDNNSLETKVVVSQSALQFVTPLSLKIFSKGNVYFDGNRDTSMLIPHVELGLFPDLIIVLPCTANMIGKCANGIADNFISTVLITAKCNIIFCPAMNPNMWSNPFLQKNVEALKGAGHLIWGPYEGTTHSKSIGTSALISVEHLLSKLHEEFGDDEDELKT